MKRVGFIAGASAAAALLPQAVRAASLYEAVERAASGATGTVGVYARRLGHPEPDVVYNADEIFPAASTIKVLIMVSAYQIADREPDFLDRKVTLALRDFVGGSDILQNANPGDRWTVHALIDAMITVSDNTASNALITLIGFDRLNATAHDAGLDNMHLKRHFMDYAAIVHHSENLTSPRDMGLMLYAIEHGAREGIKTVASPQACRAMIDIMLRQEDRDKIARGLPKGTPLANKTGEIDGVRNDVAIVDPFGENPYILTVYTKDLDDFSEGNAAIRRIAKVVHASIG